MSNPIIMKKNNEKISFKKKDEPILTEVMEDDNKGILSFRLSK
jgi:hypothetical protein